MNHRFQGEEKKDSVKEKRMTFLKVSEIRLRILAAILTIGMVVGVPSVVGPVNFMTGGVNAIGFYLAAIIAPIVLLLLYYGLFWKLSEFKRVFSPNNDEVN